MLEPIILAFAPGIEAQPAYKLRFVSCVSSDAVAPVECTSPPLHNSAIDVSVKGHARAAIRGPDARIQQRLQAAFDEVEVGGANARFLREGFFELARLELELGPDSDVEVNVAHDCAGGGVGVGQDGIVKV